MYEWKNGVKVIGEFEDGFPVRGKLVMQDGSQVQFDSAQEGR